MKVRLQGQKPSCVENVEVRHQVKFFSGLFRLAVTVVGCHFTFPADLWVCTAF